MSIGRLQQEDKATVRNLSNRSIRLNLPVHGTCFFLCANNRKRWFELHVRENVFQLQRQSTVFFSNSRHFSWTSGQNRRESFELLGWCIVSSLRSSTTSGMSNIPFYSFQHEYGNPYRWVPQLQHTTSYNVTLFFSGTARSTLAVFFRSCQIISFSVTMQEERPSSGSLTRVFFYSTTRMSLVRAFLLFFSSCTRYRHIWQFFLPLLSRPLLRKHALSALSDTILRQDGRGNRKSNTGSLQSSAYYEQVKHSQYNLKKWPRKLAINSTLRTR